MASMEYLFLAVNIKGDIDECRSGVVHLLLVQIALSAAAAVEASCISVRLRGGRA